nr:AAA family ATPase [Bathymodiolus japonicus methanotrophic gill symbiont]
MVVKNNNDLQSAHFLAQNGKKVLAVDADPQSNLTELMMSPIIADLDENEKTEVKQKLKDAVYSITKTR